MLGSLLETARFVSRRGIRLPGAREAAEGAGPLVILWSARARAAPSSHGRTAHVPGTERRRALLAWAECDPAVRPFTTTRSCQPAVSLIIDCIEGGEVVSKVIAYAPHLVNSLTPDRR